MGQWPICIYKVISNHQNAKGLLISYSLPYHCLVYFTTVPISPLTAIPWPLSPSSFHHQHHIITIIIWSPLSYRHHHIITIIIRSPSWHHHHHNIITITIWSSTSYDHHHHHMLQHNSCWPAWRLFVWGNQGTQSKHLSDAVLDLWQSDRLTKLLSVFEDSFC